MKKGIILLSVITLIFCFGSVFASEMPEIAEIYFYKEDAKIWQIEEGEISAEAVLSGVEDKSGSVAFILASYDGDKNLSDISVKLSTFEQCDGKATFKPVTAANSENAEIKAFMISRDMKSDYRYLNKSTNLPTAIKLVKGDKTYEAEIIPEKGEAIFHFDVYTLGSLSYNTPDIAGAELFVEGADLEVLEGEVNFYKTVTLLSKDKGPTVKFNVFTNNLITQKYIDYEGYTAGSDGTDITKEVGQAGTYTLSRGTLKVYDKPASGSDTAGEGKAVKYDTNQGWGGFWQDGMKDGHVPNDASRIEQSFDIRIDEIRSASVRGGFVVGRGLSYQYAQGLNGLVFGKTADYKKPADADYTIAFAQDLNIVPWKKPLSLKYKQWYNIKIVTNIYDDDFSYDIYVDGKYYCTEKPVICENFTSPLPKINGTFSCLHVDVSKNTTSYITATPQIFYVTNQGRADFTAWFDNMTVKFAYKGDKKPTLYMVGDSIMQTYHIVNSKKLQGWGFYVPDHMDSEKIRTINLARSGHRAQWLLSGKSDGTYQPDWQHIKTQLKDGDFVLISVGVNDVQSGGRTKEQCKSYLRPMILDAKAAGATVIIASEPPRKTFDSEGINDFVKRDDESIPLTPAFREVAEEEGVTFLDVEAAMYDVLQAEVKTSSVNEVWAKYYTDNTHLNETGSALYASEFAKLLKNSDNTLKNYTN